ISAIDLRPNDIVVSPSARDGRRSAAGVRVRVLAVACAQLGGAPRVFDLGFFMAEQRRALSFHRLRDRANDHLLFEDGALADPYLLLVQRYVDGVLLERAVGARRGVPPDGHVLDDDLLARHRYGEALF